MSLAIYPVLGLAAIHYLDDAAARALDRLAPALSVDDDDLHGLRDQLTTLPPETAVRASLAGLAFAIGYVVLGSLAHVRQVGPAVLVFDAAMAMIGFPILALLFYHTVRQLRLISRIQSGLPAVDVFRLQPLYAFSGVTARSGLVLVGLAYLSALTDPSTFTLTNPTLLGFVVISILIATAAFIVPMYGMHERIVGEKARLEAEADRDLKDAFAELSTRARTRDLTEAAAFNDFLSSLTTRREVLSRIPTWPWQAATLRGFVTAVLLPIALWLAFRALDRLLV